MSRKKKSTEKKTPAKNKKEEEREISPFASIVLKEKKESEKKKAPLPSKPKKPGEIVQGYVPSASFADILDSFEKTGNPYRLPQQKASRSTSSFGDILDQWEGKKSGKKDKKKKEYTPSPEYKATRSFGDILDQYEGVVRKEKKKEEKKDGVKKTEKKEETKGSTLFMEENEEDKPSPNAVWSVIGGLNKEYVRKEEKAEEKEEKKTLYNRVSPSYSPSKSFSEILSQYEGKKEIKPEASQPVEEEKKEKVVVEEHTFFIEKDEDAVISDSVVWSIMGGVNENFVRHEEKEEEKEEIEEEEEKTISRISKPYVPTKSFSEILSQYGESVGKEEKKEETEVPLSISIFEPPKENTFFLEENEENKPSSNVAWSIVGGANKDYVRKEEEKEEVPPTEKPKYERKSEPYEPKKKFSSILTSYEKKEVKAEKTFEEIMKEKGDNAQKKPRTYTINELRSMNPQSTLDLHGENRSEGEKAIRDFLTSSMENGLRKVSVITGKGLHSEDGQCVMRTLLEEIIRDLDFIMEYSNAPLNKGGSGAMWIVLKEKKK